MAFIVGTDSLDVKRLGLQGQAVIGSVRHIYYTEDNAITNYNLVDSASTWKKIHFVEEFNATDTTNKVEVFDGKTLAETLEGKTTSELKLTQVFRGWLNSIGKLKGKKLWWAEAYTDDRDAIDANGNYKFYEIRLVQGSLTSVSEEKGDAEAVQKITGEGSYTVSTQKKLFRGITPVNVTCVGTGSGTTTRTVTVNATDFATGTLDLTDCITANTNTGKAFLGEITAVTVVKAGTGSAGGTANYTIAKAGGNDNGYTINITGGAVSQTIIVNATITTTNGGTFTSPNLTITL